MTIDGLFLEEIKNLQAAHGQLELKFRRLTRRDEQHAKELRERDEQHAKKLRERDEKHAKELRERDEKDAKELRERDERHAKEMGEIRSLLEALRTTVDKHALEIIELKKK